MSEDDEINFYGLCPRPLVTKGLNSHNGTHVLHGILMYATELWDSPQEER